MQAQTGTLIGAGMGLFGALVGHLLTRSWQREQWLRDRRIQEYADVVSAVTSAYLALVRLLGKRGTSLHTQEAMSECATITVESIRVLRDRIFIARELAISNVVFEWQDAIHQLERTQNLEAFGERFTALNAKLVDMALQTPAKSVTNFDKRRSPVTETRENP